MNAKISSVPPRKRRKETSKRDAEASRARILEAAKIRFSQNSYEGAGIREIAGDAGVDPALVMRYFGSKEGLFREIASSAFDADDILSGGISALPQQAAEMLMGTLDSAEWRRGYDPLRLLLASIGSPAAGPILSDYLDRDFVGPIAAAMDLKERDERAVILAAQILGFALVRIALAGRKGRRPRWAVLQRLLTKALDVTLSGGSREGAL